jgi:hypothetical protein
MMWLLLGCAALFLSASLMTPSSAWLEGAGELRGDRLEAASVSADMLFAGAIGSILPSKGVEAVPAAAVNILKNTGTRGMFYKIVYEGTLIAARKPGSEGHPLRDLRLGEGIVEKYKLHSPDLGEEAFNDFEEWTSSPDGHRCFDGDALPLKVLEGALEASAKFEVEPGIEGFEGGQPEMEISFGDLASLACLPYDANETPPSQRSVEVSNGKPTLKFYHSFPSPFDISFHLNMETGEAEIAVHSPSMAPELLDEDAWSFVFDVPVGFDGDLSPQVSIAWRPGAPLSVSLRAAFTDGLAAGGSYSRKRVYYGHSPNPGDCFDFGDLAAEIDYSLIDASGSQGSPFSASVSYEAVQGTREAALARLGLDQSLLEGMWLK